MRPFGSHRLPVHLNGDLFRDNDAGCGIIWHDDDRLSKNQLMQHIMSEAAITDNAEIEC